MRARLSGRRGRTGRGAEGEGDWHEFDWVGHFVEMGAGRDGESEGKWWIDSSCYGTGLVNCLVMGILCRSEVRVPSVEE